ncbi:basic proline-rich protein-like [Pipra filicauda]|uniref:Basic proline-rich protein-like n=1 Tax=Pipra filicauda TaxID=649802 RepID=A0A7R5L5K0_9PASS|nr:basic proline-rich protein-like [Pipra filicauda]
MEIAECRSWCFAPSGRSRPCPAAPCPEHPKRRHSKDKIPAVRINRGRRARSRGGFVVSRICGNPGNAAGWSPTQELCRLCIPWFLHPSSYCIPPRYSNHSSPGISSPQLSHPPRYLIIPPGIEFPSLGVPSPPGYSIPLRGPNSTHFSPRLCIPWLSLPGISSLPGIASPGSRIPPPRPEYSPGSRISLRVPNILLGPKFPPGPKYPPGSRIYRRVPKPPWVPNPLPPPDPGYLPGPESPPDPESPPGPESPTGPEYSPGSRISPRVPNISPGPESPPGPEYPSGSRISRRVPNIPLGPEYPAGSRISPRVPNIPLIPNPPQVPSTPGSRIPPGPDPPSLGAHPVPPHLPIPAGRRIPPGGPVSKAKAKPFLAPAGQPGQRPGAPSEPEPLQAAELPPSRSMARPLLPLLLCGTFSLLLLLLLLLRAAADTGCSLG